MEVKEAETKPFPLPCKMKYVGMCLKHQDKLNKLFSTEACSANSLEFNFICF